MRAAIHADLLLTGKRGWTPERLRAAAYDPYLPAFARLLPGLVAAWRALPARDPRRQALAAPIATAASDGTIAGATTRSRPAWRCSGATSCGARSAASRRPSGSNVPDYIATRVDAAAKLAALDAAVDRLTRDFGELAHAVAARSTASSGSTTRSGRTSTMPQPSTPVPFTSAQWGSLASFGAKTVAGDEALLRHQRQQLRRGRRVRPAREGDGGDGRRPERRSGVAPLRRPDRPLRGRPAPPGLLPPRRTRRPCRAQLPPGRLT